MPLLDGGRAECGCRRIAEPAEVTHRIVGTVVAVSSARARLQIQREKHRDRCKEYLRGGAHATRKSRHGGAVAVANYSNEIGT